MSKKKVKSYFNRAKEWMQEGDFAQVFNEYSGGLDSNPDHIERAFLTSDFIHKMVANYQISASLLSSCLVDEPENEMAFFYRGLCHLVGGRSEFSGYGSLSEAMANFNASIIINRRNPFPYFGRAKAWLYEGDMYEALDDAKTALELNKYYDSTINFREFADFIEKNTAKTTFVEYHIGKMEGYIKDEYEGKHSADESKHEWEHIDQRHRFKIKNGAILRSYVKPYAAPNEIFYTEHEVLEEPHATIGRHPKVRGWNFEVIRFNDGHQSQVRHFFEGEVWIKKSCLKYPFGQIVSS